MRCWASFAVAVAALIGIPYQAVASTPSAVTISAVDESAVEESTADSDSNKSKPARYSLGDKSSAKAKGDSTRSTKSSTPPSGLASKVVRKLGDSTPAATPRPAPRPVKSKEQRN